MTDYRVQAVSEKLARKIRETRKSPGYGHPVNAEVATGYGPCRSCLRDFEVGVERRLLFTFDPFFGIEEFPLPGPVFIHEDECSRYPEDSGFPADVLGHDLTLVAYGKGRLQRVEERATGGAVETAVARMLARPDVDYVLVRDTPAGCYDFRIERA
jgi:hypothetical protein